MHKLQLPNVTLLGVDCVNVERLQEAMNICEAGVSFAESKLLTSLPTSDPRKVKIPHIASIEGYSGFCLKDLYRYVNTDFVLIVQYDGFILNPESWEAEFFQYDYIGAPWFVDGKSVSEYGFPSEWQGSFVVGNGGFSLRSKKLLEVSADLARGGKIAESHPEDCVICVYNRDLFEEKGIRFAPPEVGLRFSIEGHEHVTYKKQFGFHGFKWTDISTWIRQHPEYPIAAKNSKKFKIEALSSSLKNKPLSKK